MLLKGNRPNCKAQQRYYKNRDARLEAEHLFGAYAAWSKNPLHRTCKVITWN